jgi:hypothetical protein
VVTLWRAGSKVGDLTRPKQKVSIGKCTAINSKIKLACRLHRHWLIAVAIPPIRYNITAAPFWCSKVLERVPGVSTKEFEIGKNWCYPFASCRRLAISRQSRGLRLLVDRRETTHPVMRPVNSSQKAGKRRPLIPDIGPVPSGNVDETGLFGTSLNLGDETPFDVPGETRPRFDPTEDGADGIRTHDPNLGKVVI